jgi:dethiobiotin synthetase
MAPLIVVVSGTDTEVGKTWVATRLISSLRKRDLRVAARKPVQSFDRSDSFTDAEALAEASGEDPERVTPEHRWYPMAMAPPMAADVLDRAEIEMRELVAETILPPDGVCVVEGVGGPRSPLAHNGDTTSLARAMAADLVVIVAPAGLGAINSVMLSVGAFSPLRTIVFLNRFDPLEQLHELNRRWLTSTFGRKVVTSVDELTRTVTLLHSELAVR